MELHFWTWSRQTPSGCLVLVNCSRSEIRLFRNKFTISLVKSSVFFANFLLFQKCWNLKSSQHHNLKDFSKGCQKWTMSPKCEWPSAVSRTILAPFFYLSVSYKTFFAYFTSLPLMAIKPSSMSVVIYSELLVSSHHQRVDTGGK